MGTTDRLHVSVAAIAVAVCMTASAPVAGQNANGNDFALSCSEASSETARLALIKEAGRRPHYFRYLQIMEMEDQTAGGRRTVRVTALEPASAWDVMFQVNQNVSLTTLSEAPVSVPGRALAVSGVIKSVDSKTGTIYLEPAVIRHKDRLTPSLSGKEMLYEIDDRSIFYSFNGGREAVAVAFRDRDLLRHRDRIMAEGGDQAWADFLQLEIRKRQAQRQAGDGRP